MRNVLFAAMLLICAPLDAARGQTLDEVRKAVGDYIRDDASAQASGAALGRWGNAALPFLRELAGPRQARGPIERLLPTGRNDWAIVCSVTAVGTPEAVELLVEMLDGKTDISPHHALNGLATAVYEHADQLRSHQRFRELVFGYAQGSMDPMNEILRKQAGLLIAELGWEDGEPLLQAMLQDEDYHMRQLAAESIAQLTGRRVEVRKPALAFPRSSPSEELSFLAEMPNDDLPGRLDLWFDGKPALIQGRRGRLTALRSPGQSASFEELAWRIGDILSLPAADGGACWVLLASEQSRYPADDMAICIDWERNELWRFVPRRAGIEGLCRLYDATGCAGVALAPGGEQGVVGFDAAGRELFRVPHRYTTYGVSSNRRVPNRWLRYGGSLEVFDNGGRSVGANQFTQPSGGFFHAAHAVLAQELGQAVIVAAGCDSNSNPMILRCDPDLRDYWRATVPDPIQSLALLEPPMGEPRLVVTTDGGELLVFDLDGALHQRLDLPADAVNRESLRARIPVESICAGPLPTGDYGLAVGMLATTAVYSLGR